MKKTEKITATTVAQDVKELTVKYVKTLIESDQLDFPKANYSSLRPCLDEVMGKIEVYTGLYNKEGKEITKPAHSYFSSLRTEFLKEIHHDIEEWYNSQYFERKFNNVRIPNANPVEVLEELKKAAWMISADDLTRFVNFLINTCKYISGNNKRFQEQLWLTSSIMGGGKSTLCNQLIDGFRASGALSTSASLPDSKYPDISKFAQNHLVYVNDVNSSKSNDYSKEAYMAIGRHEEFTSQRKFMQPTQMLSRAVPIYTSNYNPLWQGDRTTKNISCIDIDVEHAETTHPELLEEALKANLDAILSLAKLEIMPVNKTKEATVDINKYSFLIEIMGQLKELKDVNYEALSIANISKLLLLAHSKELDYSQQIILSRQLRGLAVSGEITKLSKGKIEWEKFDLTNIKDWGFEMLVEGVEEDNPIDENQKKWNEIIEYYKSNNPTTPTDDSDAFDILDDFMAEELTDESVEKTTEEVKEEMELFDFIEEGETFKDQFQKSPTNNKTDQFQCLNPLKTTYPLGEDLPGVKARKDSNVSSRRNFVFEFDNISLQEQKQLVKENKDIINRVVFSGSKSLHCRVTINYNPQSNEEYKYVWHYINNTYFSGLADRACANCSRLTRTPNGVRDNGVIQKLLFKNNTVIEVEHLHKQFKEQKELNKVFKDFNQTTSYERKTDNIIDELESLSDEAKQSDRWSKAMAIALDDGTACYEDMFVAVSYYLWLGFEPEEICEQINFGSWNLDATAIRKMFN